MKRFLGAIFFAAGTLFAQSGPCTRAQSVAIDFTGTTSTLVAAVSGSRIKVCSVELSAPPASPVDITFLSNSSATVLGKFQQISAYFNNSVNLSMQTRLSESLGMTSSSSVHWTGRVSYIVETF